MNRVRYRWIYSSGPGDWLYTPDYYHDFDDDYLEEEMNYIESSEGFLYSPTWSNFEYERVTE